MSLQFVGPLLPEINYHRALIVLFVSLMAITGVGNLRHQWSIKGEYSNYPMEDLIEWITWSTPKSEYNYYFTDSNRNEGLIGILHNHYGFKG